MNEQIKTDHFTEKTIVSEQLLPQSQLLDQNETTIALKASEAKYRAFYESSTDGILLSEKSGEILSANPAACNMFRMTEEEICKAGRAGIIDETDPRVQKLMHERLKKGKANAELDFYRKDGSIFPGEASVTVFKDSCGLERTSVIIRDITERKISADKLATASQQLQTALDELNKIMASSLDVICAVDADGRFLKVSAASEAVWGYKPAELIGKQLIEFVHPADRETTQSTADNVMAGNAVNYFENRYIRKDGSVVPIEWTARWHGGERVRYGIARDVTIKKRQEKIQETERLRFSEIFKHAPSCIGVLKGPDHIFEMANPLYMKLTGKKNIIGKSVREVFSGTEGEGFFEVLDSIFITGETFIGKESLVIIVNEDGTNADFYADFIYQPFRNTENETEGIFFFANDVTEQVLSRKKIEQSEKRYRSLFEQNIAGFYQSTKEGVIVNCNAAFATMLGYDSPQDLLNTNAQELYFFPDDRADFIENVLGKKKLHNYEIILKRKNGSALYFLENIFEHTDPITEVEYFDGILIDITDRKRSEREIGWMINNTEESFILLNRALEITSFNEKAQRLYSRYFLRPFIMGKCLLDYVQPHKLPKVKAMYERVLSGITETREIVIPVPGLSFKYFTLKFKPATDDEGNIIGVFISAIDITEQKKAEQQKEFESRDKEALINTTSDVIWSVSNDFKLIAANRAFFANVKHFSGVDLLPGDDLLAEGKFPEDFLNLWRTNYLKALSGETFTEEIYSPAINGRPEFWLETRFNPIYDGETISGIACYSRDTSEGRIIRDRLLEIKNKLETAQQIAKLGYWELDLKKGTHYWSAEVYKIWGVSPETYTPGFQKFYDSIHPDDTLSYDAAKKATFDGLAKLDFEHRIILQDKTVKYVHEKGDVIRNEANEIIRFEGTVQDITERKKTEEAVHAVLKEKNIILESIGDAFFAVDKNFIVNYWNNQAEKMLGKRVGEAIGRNLWDLFPESKHSISFKNYSLALATNSVKQFEDYFPPLEKWYDISAYPSANGLSVYFKDITERKLSEVRLNELNINLDYNAKKLALSNAELEQFAYVASHDMQEPLRMVTSFLGLLEKKYADKIDDKGRTYIAFAVDGAKHMRSIILDLLEYSRVGGREQSAEEVDVNKLINEIRLLFKTDELDPFINSPILPVIHTYKLPLMQVFQNLVSNALKYCREGIPPEIFITGEDRGKYWQFMVADNGIGINDEYYEKIFTLFQRLHNREAYSGTGIGLAITKKIIGNLGGKIWVESKEGEGSRFYFTIPKT